ncbi:MAG: HIT family protein [Lentisphaerae bacterium]|nr:HIT family protein [Lentisphaerota bacterium]
MDQECVFCRIVKGDLPSCKIYEDDDVLAFMDIGPVVKGHSLVIPKAHHNAVTDVPPELLCKVVAVAQKVVRAQMAALDADGVNIHQANGRAAGQVVPHLHFHVIPRFLSDEHSWNWKTRKYSDIPEMQALADRIKSRIKG